MGREKRHHYVPRSYLARFTTSGTAEGELWVFDIDRATSWPSTPAKTALERDYNRVELEGVDPLLVEKQVFGEIEGAAKTAFDGVIAAGHEALSTGAPGIKASEATFQTVLLFLSAQSIRVPHIREGLHAFQNDAVRTIARMLAKNRKAFEAAREKDPEMGDVTFEEFQGFVAEHGTVLGIEASNTHDLGVTLPSLFPLVPVLRHRPWTLLYAPDDGPSFVTSDMPVVLVPREDDPFWGVGFGTPDSTVLFPLSRRVLLQGGPPSRDARLETIFAVMEVSARLVAVMNTQVITRAPRRIFSGDREIAWARRDRVEDSNALLALLREQSKEPEHKK